VHEDNKNSGANEIPFIYSLWQTKGSSRKFGGWPNDGMRRYKELVLMVRANRENNAEETNFETTYKANCVKAREVALNSLSGSATVMMAVGSQLWRYQITWICWERFN